MLQASSNTSGVRTKTRTTMTAKATGPHKNTIVDIEVKRWEGEICKEISTCGREEECVAMKDWMGKWLCGRWKRFFGRCVSC